MSFILDALKKSENDRQRRSGPALFEVKVAVPRTRLPSWAIAIAALLIVNLAIVMWMLVRHPERSAPAAVTAPAAATPAPLTAPVAAAASSTAGAPPPVAAPPVSAPTAAPAAAPAVATTPVEQTNPADYTAAEEPPAASPGGHVQRGTTAGVPLYQEAASAPGAQLPQLRLDLHVFAARAQDRFVMINMRKLREGEALPEGVRVESITPEGAVLSYNGSRFLLTRE